MQEERPERIFLSSDGPLIVSSARSTIEGYLGNGIRTVPKAVSLDPRFEIKLGCFVTIKENDELRSLRGCIGFAEPIYRLSKALTEAAIAAATEDPRFPSLNMKDLEEILIEVSLLSPPQLISVDSPKDFPKKIKVGCDGLIMKWDFGSGLLLPQVASELNWDPEEFLTNLSLKSGAPPTQWLMPGTQIFRFRADIFNEESPKGRVTSHFD